MKKSISVLVIVLMILFSSFAFGAGSGTTVTADNVFSNPVNGSPSRVVEVSFKADDTDGSVPDTTINNNTTGVVHGSLEGWHLWEVFIDCTSGVTPTDDSDMYVYQDGNDLIGGNGVDKVNGSTVNSVYPGIDGSGPYPRPVSGDLILTISNNSVNSAVGTITLTFK